MFEHSVPTLALSLYTVKCNQFVCQNEVSMIPIYEQGSGNGIGHDLDSFIERFESICEEHTRTGRAKFFAFIFYDFADRDLRKILKNEGVFAQLDRLSGDRISIFYLHTGTRRTIDLFNSEFLSRLSVGKATPPCVVFFQLSDDGFTDIAVAQLESADMVHGFHELYSTIDQYLESPKSTPRTNSRALTWVKSGAKVMTLEALRAALRAAFSLLF